MGEDTKQPVKQDRTRRETMAKYFLDLSKLTFTTLVLGSFVPFFTNGMDINFVMISVGVVATTGMAVVGYRLLN